MKCDKCIFYRVRNCETSTISMYVSCARSKTFKFMMDDNEKCKERTVLVKEPK